MADDPEADAGENPDRLRRRLLAGGGLAAGLALTRGAMAQTAQATQTETGPLSLDGQPVPEPPPAKSAGPVKPGRGSTLTGKVAVVTGGARGIGRAIAVEFAANGADVVVLDIAGPVSPASNAVPATPDELAETVRQIEAYGRRGEGDHGPISATSPRCAPPPISVEQTYGKIDIVVANAAIQRWMPLLEMQDSDWRDVIDNNLNGTANTIRAFAPKMVARKHGRIIVLSSMQGKHGTKDAASYSASKWGIIGLMKSAALELGEYNITVNALIPGLVDTPLTRYYKRLQREHGGDRAEAAGEADAAAGLGRARADRAVEGGLAAAGRHLARGGVPGLRCRRDGDGRRIRGHRRRQREGYLNHT